MKILLCVFAIFAFSQALEPLTITAKLKSDFDSVYKYVQNIAVFIDEAETTHGESKFEILIRPSSDGESVVGHLQNVDITNANLTEELLSQLRAPFRVVLTSDGLPKEMWTQTGENVQVLKIKDSVLKLLFQNGTKIHEYLKSTKVSFTDEKCQEVTTVSRTETEYVFETNAKVVDCNGNSTLQGVASDKSEFKVFYHISKDDERLSRALSVINVVYLTTVAARFETTQTLEFVRFDGLKEDIDESVLVEKHLAEEIDKLFQEYQQAQ